jgi:DNA-directed RNA polymerase
MDACHLQQTVLQANKAGIRSLALVHDSFGCLPTDAGRLRGIIKEAFLWLYERDVLADIRREALEQTETNMDRIRDLPEYGTYQPTEILGAEYAFA